MKMSNAFTGEIVIREYDDNLCSLSDDTGKFCIVNIHCAESVANAINSHDELVEKLEETADLMFHSSDPEIRDYANCIRKFLKRIES